MGNRTKAIIGIVAVLLVAGAIVVYNKLIAVAVPNDGVNVKVKVLENIRGLRFCEIFLFGGNAITKNMVVAVYSTIGLNYEISKNALNSTPQELVNKLDLDGIKKEYGVLSVYLNEPRFYVMDRLTVPTGAERDFNGLKMAWVASSHFEIPKGVDIKKKGWLTYRDSPVERKTEITFFKGKPVFVLDDPQGKPWVMKAYRDDYGQTYESLSTLGSRLKNLPAGWKFRVVVLDRDLVLSPVAGVAHIMQDEFENTFDYLGDGSSNFLP